MTKYNMASTMFAMPNPNQIPLTPKSNPQPNVWTKIAGIPR